MIENPKVRIVVEGMRHEMVHAFNSYADNLKAEFQRAVDLAINSFDYENEVRIMAHAELQASVRRRVQDLINSTTNSKRIQEAVKKEIVKHLKSSTNGAANR